MSQCFCLVEISNLEVINRQLIKTMDHLFVKFVNLISHDN